MKLVISQGGIKREIEAPFGICLSGQDLDDLIRKLQDIQGAWIQSRCSYGWAVVDKFDPNLASGGPPRRWDDTVKEPRTYEEAMAQRRERT